MSYTALFSPMAIAPMIDWTYTHFRVFMRLLAPHALLYTEMQTIGAIQHAPSRAFAYHSSEMPFLALQVGGADEGGLVDVAYQAEARGFAEINLNLGCPSHKVLAGQFGACLMREPVRVAQCIVAMKKAVSIPVTAKIRIGVDHDDSYDYFASFVSQLVDAGCDKIIVHARKAWLTGLSPKQNRTIPPLNYDYVYQIKRAFPDIPMVINGQIQTIDDVRAHLQHVDGVMLGRLACDDPYMIARIHHALYPETPLLTRSELLLQYLAYVLTIQTDKKIISLMLKPILNLAHALPGARSWKAKWMTMRQVVDVGAWQEMVELMMKMEDAS